MSYPRYNSKEEVLSIAESTKGHTFGEYNVNNRDLTKNKGVLGQIIEEGVFHYPINSNAKADFANLGLELKVTGIKQNKNKKYSAKERLVLNLINYMTEANKKFEDSSFWEKNSGLLLMFYLYQNNKDYKDFKIIDSVIHTFTPEELVIIQKDWETINGKIKSGEAHLISESDTMYLSACTKGSTAQKSLREQPNSSKLAKQRAYSLKQSYMTTLVNRYLLGEKCENILSYNELVGSSFEVAFTSKLNDYYGKSEKELFEMFPSVNTKSKNKFNLLIGKMLKINGNINDSEEFKKANITLKTIRVEQNGTIKEHMSFPIINYKEIIKEKWEDATINTMFQETKFMFVIFKKKGNTYYFDSVKFWNMPLKTIEEKVKPVWEIAVDAIKKGNIVKKITKKGYSVNFPGAKFNNVCHLRPHDAKSIHNGGKGAPLPVNDKLTGLNRYTKYSFWLDKNYILKVINKK